MRNLIVAMLILLTWASCSTQMKIKANQYPTPRKDSSVVDDYFGTKIYDPYRHFEDDRSSETAAWVKAENEVTFDYLSQIPYREKIKSRLTELNNYVKYGIPEVYGDYLIYYKNDGLQNQSIIYKQALGSTEAEILLDPNSFSSNGTVSLTAANISNDNKFLAYGLSQSGSDWVTLYVKNIETGEILPDTIQWIKFSGATWCKNGFYYSRYDAPTGSGLSDKNEFQKVYYHTLGTHQSDDKLIYEDKMHPLRYFSAESSDDDKYIFIISSEGTSGTEVLYKKRESKDGFKTLFKGFDFDYNIIECKSDKLLILTNDGAQNMQLTITDLSKNPVTTKPLIVETENLLESVTSVGNVLYASYLENASNKVYQFTTEGEKIREIALPTLGTAVGFYGKPEAKDVYYAFTSFNYPSQIFKLNIETGVSEVEFESNYNFNPENYDIDQVFATSKDGTKVPLFVVSRKGMIKNGQNPLHLYAYGGFNINMTPAFSATNIMFLDAGGIYVQANLRGGGEYGESWHKAGMKENKQNVFDDFIASAEYLINEGYTSTSKLAISGGSNGGLLIGACLTQRPDLYAVAIPRVGVLDMLRYQKFTIGWGWVVEYGSSDNEEDFSYLLKYSPLHNIHKGTCYPATLIMTGDHDDRVVPAHSFKFGATLQDAQGCENPILIRIDTDAGHGAGKPLSKSIDELTDMYSFIFYNIDFTPTL